MNMTMISIATCRHNAFFRPVAVFVSTALVLATLTAADAVPPRQTIPPCINLPEGYRVRTLVAPLLGPDGLAVDERGRIYACAELENRVIRIGDDGKVKTVLTGVRKPEAICYVPGGHLYVGEDVSDARIFCLDVETLRAEVISQNRFADLEGIRVDPQRTTCWVGCYRWEIGSDVVRAAFDCRLSDVALGDGQWQPAEPSVPLRAGQVVPLDQRLRRWWILPRYPLKEAGITEIVFDAAGRQYFGTEGSSVCRVGADGKVEVVADGLGTPEGLCFDSEGNLWVAEESGGRVSIIKADYLARRKPSDPPARPAAFGKHGDVEVFADGLGSVEDVLVTSEAGGLKVYVSCETLFSILLIEPTHDTEGE